MKKRGPLSGRKKQKARPWPEVRVVVAGGKVERVSALRAARWIEAGEAQLPEDFTAEEGRAVLEARDYRTGQVLKRLSEDGLPWRIAMTSSSFTSIVSAVESGLGVSAFAESTAPEALVVERRKPWPDLGTVSVGLYRHPDGANGAGQRLADYLLESLDIVERKSKRRVD